MVHVVETTLELCHLLENAAEAGSEVWSYVTDSSSHEMFEFKCMQLI